MARRHGDKNVLAAFAESHQFCQYHGPNSPLCFGGLEIHHILGGVWSRPDLPWNLIRLCWLAHRRCEGKEKHNGILYPKIERAELWKIKKESGEYDEADIRRYCQGFGRMPPEIMEEMHGRERI